MTFRVLKGGKWQLRLENQINTFPHNLSRKFLIKSFTSTTISRSINQTEQCTVGEPGRTLIVFLITFFLLLLGVKRSSAFVLVSTSHPNRINDFNFPSFKLTSILAPRLKPPSTRDNKLKWIGSKHEQSRVSIKQGFVVGMNADAFLHRHETWHEAQKKIIEFN